MKFSITIALLCFFQSSYSQENPIGIFDYTADIGKPGNSGYSSYDTVSQIYYMKGSGYNIWFNRDEFQYLY
jgi:TolB protein